MATIKSPGLQMAMLLDDLSNVALTLDAKNESSEIRYHEDDVINALTIFMHVCGNFAIHQYIDKKIEAPKSLKHHIKCAEKLRKWMIDMTGIDPHKYFSQKP